MALQIKYLMVMFKFVYRVISNFEGYGTDKKVVSGFMPITALTASIAPLYNTPNPAYPFRSLELLFFYMFVSLILENIVIHWFLHF